MKKDTRALKDRSRIELHNMGFTSVGIAEIYGIIKPTPLVSTKLFNFTS